MAEPTATKPTDIIIKILAASVIGGSNIISKFSSQFITNLRALIKKFTF